MDTIITIIENMKANISTYGSFLPTKIVVVERIIYDVRIRKEKQKQSNVIVLVWQIRDRPIILALSIFVCQDHYFLTPIWRT